MGDEVKLADVCGCGHTRDWHGGGVMSCKECKGTGSSCRSYKSIVPMAFGELTLTRQFHDGSWLVEDWWGKVARYWEAQFEVNEVVAP